MASGVLPRSGVSLSAAVIGSLIRYGVALTSAAGSETASGLPLRSTIEPRSAGSFVLVTCWDVAACASDPALTPPSQSARPAAATSRIRNAAKRSPMRRSRSATSLASRARGGDARGRLRVRLLLLQRLLLRLLRRHLLLLHLLLLHLLLLHLLLLLLGGRGRLRRRCRRCRGLRCGRG